VAGKDFDGITALSNYSMAKTNAHIVAQQDALA